MPRNIRGYVSTRTPIPGVRAGVSVPLTGAQPARRKPGPQQPSYAQCLVISAPITTLAILVSPWFWWGFPAVIVGWFLYAVVWYTRNS